jgi:ribonuclease BN (tRNA processing enzyme)
LWRRYISATHGRRRPARQTALPVLHAFALGSHARIWAHGLQRLGKHAYAFRFDTRDRSIVISGDTNYAPGLIALAKGADVLVHEVLYLPSLDRILAGVSNATALRKHLIDSHTVPEDVGRVAAQAEVKTVVLSHFVPASPEITDGMWSAGVRRHFKGQIIVGKDLMEI